MADETREAQREPRSEKANQLTEGSVLKTKGDHTTRTTFLEETSMSKVDLTPAVHSYLFNGDCAVLELDT